MDFKLPANGLYCVSLLGRQMHIEIDMPTATCSGEIVCIVPCSSAPENHILLAAQAVPRVVHALREMSVEDQEAFMVNTSRLFHFAEEL